MYVLYVLYMYVCRMVMEVILPDNPLFAPQLDVRCFDKRLGSVNSLLLGSMSISLGSKLEWNTGEYIASDKHSLLAENARIREQGVVETPTITDTTTNVCLLTII